MNGFLIPFIFCHKSFLIIMKYVNRILLQIVIEQTLMIYVILGFRM